MSGHKNQSGESGARTAADDVRRAFSALSFDDQVVTLIRVELDMLGEALNTVVSAASKVVDDIGRTCARTEPSGSATPGTGGSTSAS